VGQVKTVSEKLSVFCWCCKATIIRGVHTTGYVQPDTFKIRTPLRSAATWEESATPS